MPLQPDESFGGRAEAVSGQGICVASLDGTIRHANGAFCELCGFPEGIDEEKPPHLEQLLPGWQKGVDAEGPVLELMRGDDRPIRVGWAATVCGDEVVGALRPQTGSRAPSSAEDRLMPAIAQLSHDLRLPLTGLLNGLQLSLSERDAEAARRQVVMAYRSASFLQELLDGLVDVGKLAAGRKPLRRQAFAVGRLVEAVADTFRSAAEAKQLQLSARLDEAVPPEVVGDPIRIQRVLHNLVHNAVKFTERGKVEIRVTAAGVTARRATLVFRVQDTGPGLSRTNRSGLGLVIARELVGVLGGSFSIRQNSRQGAHLQFTVPVRVASTAEGRSGADAAPPPARPLRCLVVEDTPSNAMVLQQLLERSGHRAACVATSREAQRSCRESSFDVALVDLDLPDGDGLDLVEVLRGPGRVPYCIAVTAHVLPEFRTRCLDAGFDGYLTKPIGEGELAWELHAAETLAGEAHPPVRENGTPSRGMPPESQGDGH